MTEVSVDGRIARGEATRRAVLRRAADIASVEGLAGLSIGRLAAELDISKSGVFAHFGSKEELQLATITTATEIFRAEVVDPALEAPPGIRRLWRLCTAWVSLVERRVFPGGCFFYAVTAEFGSRPGRIRDAILAGREDLRRLFLRCVRDGRQLGEIEPEVDEEQLVFELAALVSGATTAARVDGGLLAYRRGLPAMLARLRQVATDPAALPDPAYR